MVFCLASALMENMTDIIKWKWIILGVYLSFIAILLACTYAIHGRKPPKPPKNSKVVVAFGLDAFDILRVQTGVDQGIAISLVFIDSISLCFFKYLQIGNQKTGGL